MWSLCAGVGAQVKRAVAREQLGANIARDRYDGGTTALQGERLAMPIDWSRCPAVRARPGYLSGRPALRDDPRVLPETIIDTMDYAETDDETAAAAEMLLREKARFEEGQRQVTVQAVADLLRHDRHELVRDADETDEEYSARGELFGALLDHARHG
jgi:hypothetical protein